MVWVRVAIDLIRHHDEELSCSRRCPHMGSGKARWRPALSLWAHIRDELVSSLE